jgi:hypothetical protein
VIGPSTNGFCSVRKVRIKRRCAAWKRDRRAPVILESQLPRPKKFLFLPGILNVSIHALAQFHQRLIDVQRGASPKSPFCAMMDGEFDENQVVAISDVVSQLGVADMRAFGLTWEDCEQLLRQLGYTARVDIVAA